MARLKYNKDELLADWKSGTFTERDIAYKYKMSAGTAHKIVTGIDKTMEPLISKQVEINQELANLNEHEVSKFKQEVDERTKHINLFNNLAVKNAIKASELLCETQSDHERLSNTILRSKEVVLGKAPDTAIQVNNNNQPVQAIQVEIIRVG